MKEGKRLALFALFAVLALVYTACSNSSSDDGGSSVASGGLLEGDIANYSGSFTVAGKRYSVISFDADGGGYTMKGTGGTDTGSYAVARSARAAAERTYTLISPSLGGDFELIVTDTTSRLRSGSIEASGTGANLYPSAEIDLPTSVGSDPFTGKTYKYDGHHDEFSFSNGICTKTHTSEEDNWTSVTTYRYSYNTETKNLYMAVESRTKGSYYKVDGSAVYDSTEIWTRQEYIDDMFEHINNDFNEAVWTEHTRRDLSGLYRSYEIDANSGNITLSLIPPETVIGNNQEAGLFSWGVSSSGKPLPNRGDGGYFYVISDNGSELELAVVPAGQGWVDQKGMKTIGYISALYTIGISYSIPCCELTYTAVQESLGSLYTELKGTTSKCFADSPQMTLIPVKE